MSAPLERVVLRQVSHDHPAFAGHFPGAPILPGVALLSEVMEALVQHVAPVGLRGCFDSVKFLAPVGPGAVLKVSLRTRQLGHGFEVHVGDTLVARGQWVPLPGA